MLDEGVSGRPQQLGPHRPGEGHQEGQAAFGLGAPTSEKACGLRRHEGEPGPRRGPKHGVPDSGTEARDPAGGGTPPVVAGVRRGSEARGHRRGRGTFGRDVARPARRLVPASPRSLQRREAGGSGRAPRRAEARFLGVSRRGQPESLPPLAVRPLGGPLKEVGPATSSKFKNSPRAGPGKRGRGDWLHRPGARAGRGREGPSCARFWRPPRPVLRRRRRPGRAQ